MFPTTTTCLLLPHSIFRKHKLIHYYFCFFQIKTFSTFLHSLSFFHPFFSDCEKALKIWIFFILFSCFVFEGVNGIGVKVAVEVSLSPSPLFSTTLVHVLCCCVYYLAISDTLSFIHHKNIRALSNNKNGKRVCVFFFGVFLNNIDFEKWKFAFYHKIFWKVQKSVFDFSTPRNLDERLLAEPCLACN